jgi:hypothetical protein
MGTNIRVYKEEAAQALAIVRDAVLEAELKLEALIGQYESALTASSPTPPEEPEVPTPPVEPTPAEPVVPPSPPASSKSSK